MMQTSVRSRKRSCSTTSISTTTVNGDITRVEVVETHEEKHFRSKRILYRYSDLPLWQRDNDKIWSGYIKETGSFRQCLRSLFYFHNESINVYSHLLPSIFYLLVAIFLLDKICITIVPSTTYKDYIFINIFLLGCSTCLMMSGCFHCLKQHSESQSKLWSKIDYMGIIVLISCSMISMIYYGYFDHLNYMISFILLILVLGTVCSFVVTNERFNQNHWKPIRAGFFVSFALSGLVPLLFGVFKFGYREVLNRICLKFIWLETVFYLIGATLYGFKIPESLIPGRVDLLGNSHQVFHLMVVMGSLCHCKAVIESYKLLHKRFS